jgi:hypothetical protein
VTAGYSGTPLARKLGVREGSRLITLGAPENFMELLQPMPASVSVGTRATGEADVIVLFVTRFSKFMAEFAKASRLMPASGGMLWVAWPKKAAKTDTDLDENLVRDHGLTTGLVDTKVCAIDERWSGLRFSRRKAK